MPLESRLTTFQDSSNGLRAVREIAKRLKLDGVYGPLYELFEVTDKYKTAVEVTAGNRYVSDRPLLTPQLVPCRR